MKKWRVLVPMATIAALLVLLVLPVGASAAPKETVSASGGCIQWHYVRCGQTLASIARMYGTSVSYLAAINGLPDPNRIYAGTYLCVRTAHPKPCGFWYTVKRGDTLGNIGWRFGWSASYLASVNHLCNPNLIYPGQRLWIPCHPCGWCDP